MYYLFLRFHACHIINKILPLTSLGFASRSNCNQSGLVYLNSDSFGRSHTSLKACLSVTFIFPLYSTDFTNVIISDGPSEGIMLGSQRVGGHSPSKEFYLFRYISFPNGIPNASVSRFARGAYRQKCTISFERVC
jgi:hypothetical protein